MAKKSMNQKGLALLLELVAVALVISVISLVFVKVQDAKDSSAATRLCASAETAANSPSGIGGNPSPTPPPSSGGGGIIVHNGGNNGGGNNGGGHNGGGGNCGHNGGGGSTTQNFNKQPTSHNTSSNRPPTNAQPGQRVNGSNSSPSNPGNHSSCQTNANSQIGVSQDGPRTGTNGPC